MSKSIEHKKKSVFLRILEDKRAIRKCVQEGGDVKCVSYICGEQEVGT